MWIVIYLTQNGKTANEIFSLLKTNGVPVKLRNLSSGKTDTTIGSFEILVTEAETDKAHNLLIDAGY